MNVLYPYRTTSLLIKAQVSSFVVITRNFDSYPTMDNLGLYITWPTSYEALVGRAELKAGMIISLISFILLRKNSFAHVGI